MELKKIAQDADNDFRNENFESAINAYKLILEKIPVNPKVLSNIGNCYFKIGNSDKAIEYLSKAYNTGQKRPSQAVYLARALFKEGKKDDARALLRQLIKQPFSESEPVEDFEQHEIARNLLNDWE